MSEGVYLSVGFLMLVLVLVCLGVRDCQGNNFVAECVLENPETLNIEDVCAAKWRVSR